jgi:tetratricopeptide (TPR) repeat protein
LAAAWFFTGPFFICLGNLPFDAQSTGVLERFYILPALFAVFGIGFFFDALRGLNKPAAALLFILPGFVAVGSSRAYPLRHDFLAQDYVRGIFRSLPPGAAFFMDGGDDTFFTTAFQQFVQRQRPDLRLFDRGGLIFSSAYGPDFRRLDRNSKEERRQWMERSWLEKGPLFYSTMNEKILPGVSAGQRGFLYQADGAADDTLWEMYAIRSLYPPASDDFRTHALAPYFPFLRGRALWRSGRFDDAMKYLDRAWTLGPGVPWLKNNLVSEYLEFAYGRLREKDWDTAGMLSQKCLSIDPANIAALSNMGVIAEQRGNLPQAAEWYERALSIDRGRVDVIYNLSVVRWRQNDWDRVIPLLQEVLRLNPNHPQARQYLPQAMQRRARG